MALPICSTLSISCSVYVRNSKPITMSSLASCSCSSSSTSLHSSLEVSNFTLSSRFSQMGLRHFGSWNGLKHMGISISPCPQKIRSRNRCKGQVVHASLFGVGAPEALVIGAVALLVFGPKGLAEVARNLGKTLRAFQPTIKELQEVSREFKNTLEREIGLDDDLSSGANTSSKSSSSVEKSQNVPVADPNGTTSNNAYNDDPLKIIKEHLNAPAAAPQDLSSSPPETQVEIGSQSQDSNPPNGAISSEDQLKITEEQLEASVSTQQDVASSPPPPTSEIEEESQPQVAIQETAVAASPSQKPETET